MGAWIEIVEYMSFDGGTMSSLPTWERGLKSIFTYVTFWCNWVAPHVGAWIEIGTTLQPDVRMLVAPHVGAWIEMTFLLIFALDC